MSSNVRKYSFGAAFMLVGSAAVIGTLLIINHLAGGPEDQQLVQSETFQIEKKVEPKPKRVVRREQPKPRRNRTQTPPMVDLDMSLSGIDFGIPGVDFDDLGGLRDQLLGDTGDVIMTDDSVDSPPRPVYQGPVPYPSNARNQGVEGYVVLSLLISAAGEIEKVQVLEANPAGTFEDSAVQGVRGWRFEPAQYQGRNVKVWAKQRIRFDLT